MDNLSEKEFRVRWMGHSTWELTTTAGKRIVIDPWYTDNPKSPDANPLMSADWVLLTHDHWDHVKDVHQFVKSGARVVTQPEVEERFVTEEKLPRESFVRMNIGGTVTLDDIHLTMIHAHHSARRGTAAGLVIQRENTTIMNLGDTGLFNDLLLFGELWHPTLLMVPIGGQFTMGSFEAARAVKMIQPKACVPMHYGTFSILEQTPDLFINEVRMIAQEVECWAPRPGEIREW